jgi:hypothetical protein
MMFRFMSLVVCIWLVAGTVAAQLPPRPKDGGPEPAISEDQQVKVAKLLDNFSANFLKLDRYACAVWLEKTEETYGESVGFYEYWAMHARNSQMPVRRLDHIQQLLKHNPRYEDGLPRMSFSRVTTFEGPKTVFQVQGNSHKQLDRPVTDEDSEEFAKAFSMNRLFDVDPWLIPFEGFRIVGSQGRAPTRYWREEPLYPAKLQKVFIAAALAEDVRTTMVRFVPSEPRYGGMAYDVVFSKMHGNMPIKSVLTYNNDVYKGVATSVSTEWKSFRLDRKTVYLPVRVRCQIVSGKPQKPSGKSDWDGVISWLVNKDVPDFVFDTTEETFLSADKLRDLIQANALNK